MQRLPAASGLKWIREGFALFRRQPNQLSLLFLLYSTLGLMMLVVVPPIGSLVMVLLSQCLITGFMLGCAYVDAGRQARPGLLFFYLKKPMLMRLAGLGACYMLAQFIAIGVVNLACGSALADAVAKVGASASASQQVDPASQLLMVRAFFIGISTYAVLVLPLWFAAPLIAWQGMSVAKAIFFSFFSVLRAIKAFFVYILAWCVIAMFIMLNLGALITLLPASVKAFGLLLLIPCSLFGSLLYFASFYPSYVELFGKPELPPQE